MFQLRSMTAAAYTFDAVAKAFDVFRAKYPAKAPMKEADNSDQLKLIDTDELIKLHDGCGVSNLVDPPEIPRDPPNVHLWVVRPADVVHAVEKCAFAEDFEGKILKHTNLTGGDNAHCGGELILLDEHILAVNGGSGRYGPASEVEMLALAKAFKDSGYGVWYYGFDDETGTPSRFGSRFPEWMP